MRPVALTTPLVTPSNPLASLCNGDPGISPCRDFFKSTPAQDPKQDPNPLPNGNEKKLVVEYCGQKFEITLIGEATPAQRKAMENQCQRFAKVFGIDFLKHAAGGQSDLEPPLIIYLAKNEADYARVLREHLGYSNSNATQKSQQTSGIYYFEKNAIAMQTDIVKFEDVFCHEVAHYLDDLLKLRTQAEFTAEDDMFSAHRHNEFHRHYASQRKQVRGPHCHRGFASVYGAHGDEGKCFLFEWFAENVKFMVDHFDNPTPPEHPDSRIAIDVQSLALWTQGRGFSGLQQWRSLNPPTPPPVIFDLTHVRVKFPNSRLDFPEPTPRIFEPPPVTLRDHSILTETLTGFPFELNRLEPLPFRSSLVPNLLPWFGDSPNNYIDLPPGFWDYLKEPGKPLPFDTRFY